MRIYGKGNFKGEEMTMDKQFAKCTGFTLFIMLIAGVITVIGCGGGGGGGGESTVGGPSGKVTMGAVSKAIVYADHSSGTERNFKMDADEAETSTTTDDNGNFEMPVMPGFGYGMVAIGGTDTLTGNGAMFMLAPAGARNISLLTTLVALNPNVKADIESLGIAYDSDLTTTITPAAAFFVQSIQTAVKAAVDAVNPGGNSLKISDLNDIQREILTEIANEIQTQGQTLREPAAGATAPHVKATPLTNTAALTAILQSSLTRALTAVAKKKSNITITNIPQVAQQISGPIVDAIANAIGQSTGTLTFSTTTVVAENTIITTVTVSNISTTRNNVVGTISVSITVVPPVDVPAVLSGTPAPTAPVGVPYSFVPTVTDTDKDVDCFIFSIVNKPKWAKFNKATGALTGTPKAKDVGTTAGIIISVQDGINTTSSACIRCTGISSDGKLRWNWGFIVG